MTSAAKKTDRPKSQKQGQDAASKLDASKDAASKSKDESKGVSTDTTIISKTEDEKKHQVKSLKDDPPPLESVNTTAMSPSGAKRRSRRHDSESSKYNERGSSSSSGDDESTKVIEPRRAKWNKLQKDLMLWGLPSYAVRSRLPGKATVMFDGDKNKWTSFCHDLAVCLQSRGQQYIALLNNNPQEITDEILSKVMEAEPMLDEAKQQLRVAAILDYFLECDMKLKGYLMTSLLPAARRIVQSISIVSPTCETWKMLKAEFEGHTTFSLVQNSK